MDKTQLPFQPGDVLMNANERALARMVRVTAIDERKFVADVLEGEDTKAPLTVFAEGWWLYAKHPCPRTLLIDAIDFTDPVDARNAYRQLCVELGALVGELRRQIAERDERDLNDSIERDLNT